MRRLIKEEPVDKEQTLQSMTSVKESITRTHAHLKNTWTHMKNSISILWAITSIAKELKISWEYSKVLSENPDFLDNLLDEIIEWNIEFIEKMFKQKWINLTTKEIEMIKKRQKIMTKSKIKYKINQFQKFKVFIQWLVAKTQDLNDLIDKIKKLKEDLWSAKKINKKAQLDQETSINLMEALCEDFDEKQKIDELTWLGNKKYFENMGRKYIEKKEDFHVVFIDLNGLWETNNTYWHDAGDSLLRDFAKDLANVLWWDRNTAFRLHGDEFTVISKEDLWNITAKMEKLTEWLERRRYKIMSEWKVIHIEGKFAYGITEKEKWDTISDIKWRAEKAMYIHKARMKWETDKYSFWNN